MKFGFFLKFQDPPRAENIVRSWQENFEIAQLGEQLGYDACFTPEHHGIPDGYNPSPLVTLAAVSGVTTELKLGTAVHLLPFQNPLHTAEDGAMLDVVSNGRLILGVGISGVEAEYQAFGLDIKRQASLFEEGIEILLRAWTEEEFSFYGRNYRIRNWRIAPKPVQKPHPPLWMGAMSEAGVRRAGRIGLPWVTDPMNKLETYKRWYQTYKQIASSRGNRTEVNLWRDGWVSKTRKEAEEAQRMIWPHIRADRWFYLSSFPGRGWGGGTKEDPHSAIEPWVKNIRKPEDIQYEDVASGLVIGTAEEVIDLVDSYRKELDINYLIFRNRFGTGPTLEKVKEWMKLLAKEVIPYFQKK